MPCKKNNGSAPAEYDVPELLNWLHVSGDLDDFIYYGEEPQQSEK